MVNWHNNESRTTYLGFRKQEKDGEQDKREPDAVNDVVFPAQILQADGVDELVEEVGRLGGAHQEGDALGPDLEGHDFDRVGDGKGVPADAVGADEEDDGGQDTRADAPGRRSREHAPRDGPGYHAEQHAQGGREENGPAADAAHEVGTNDGDNHAPNLEDAVDQRDALLRMDADESKDRGQVVGHKPVAGPLGEKGTAEDEECAVLVGSASDQLPPGPAARCPLQADGVADVLKLAGDQRGALLPVGVVLDQDLARLLLAALADEPARAFREKVKRRDVDQGRHSLQQGRKTPRPFRLDVEAAKGRPSCDDGLRKGRVSKPPDASKGTPAPLVLPPDTRAGCTSRSELFGNRDARARRRSWVLNSRRSSGPLQ